ncbi:hypothetical protein RB195_012801 [Necator americanus]|uniref:SSD domain-containing protein n=1 Tax=Necator americanus TaxID=51031 RepID=A0ABR1DSV7_NECAM
MGEGDKVSFVKAKKKHFRRTQQSVQYYRISLAIQGGYVRNDDRLMNKEVQKAAQRRPSRFALIWELVSIRLLFYLLGRAVGEYPRSFLLLSMLMSLTSMGMKYLLLRDNIREGYTPVNAESYYESLVMREFSNSSVDPMRLACMMLARDGKSMHRKEYLDEADRIVKAIYGLTVKSGHRRIIYRQICEPYCFGTEAFKTFKEYFDRQYKMAVEYGYFSSLYNLTYPYSTIIQERMPIDNFFFGVKLIDQNETEAAKNKSRIKRVVDWLEYWVKTYDIDRTRPIEYQITNMEHVTLLALFLYGSKNTKFAVTDLSLWELGVYDWAKRYNKGMFTKKTLIELFIFGNHILDMEVNADNRKLAPYFGGGFGFMIGIVVFFVFSSAYYSDALDSGKILIGIGAILCPLLAITCTYGILSLMQLPINSLLFVMPFLIMGVGVDSSFLMTYSWQKLANKKCSTSERLGVVYQDCGPSITISSLTNILAFAVGYLTPTPEVQAFCFGTATAMGLTYIFQMILFGPTLAVAAASENPKSYVESLRGWRSQIDVISRVLFRIHCVIVSHGYIALLILIATLVYWYYSIDGILTMRISLDSAKILPRDSLLHKPNSLLTDFVWKENLMPYIFVNTRFNITDRNLTKQFWNALKELESLPHCKGPNSSYVWYRNFVNDNIKTKSDYPLEDIVDPKKLSIFLALDARHFNTSMKLSNSSGTLTVERFFIILAYTNVSNWDIRIKLMTQWREIIAKYPDLNMTVYEEGGMFVDQMLSLKRLTVQTALLTLLSMTAICAIFIGRPWSVLTACASMASISIGVIGIMSKLSFELDPVVMIAHLMTIGMSVDYVAHAIYHFQRDSRSEVKGGISVQVALKSMAEKVEHTVLSVAWPMVQAGLSTVCCVLPLTFAATYSSSVFFSAILLVVLFGLTHGLIILPSFLSRFSGWFNIYNCCNMRRESGGGTTTNLPNTSLHSHDSYTSESQENSSKTNPE